MTITVDLGVLLPVLAPALGAALVLVLDILAVRARRLHYAVAGVAVLVGALGTIGGLGAATGDSVSTLCLQLAPGATQQCFYSASALSSSLQLAALLAAGVTLLLAWPSERAANGPGAAVTVALLLSATAGATGVAAARDLASWLVTLELATLPVVALAALPGTRRALAGAVQLLTTSLVSFAMLTLAAAAWYAATGSPALTGAAVLAASSTPQKAVLSLALVLVLGGVAFKLSLVPFHAWTPVAYGGAPLPVTVFLASVSKVAALAALLVVLSAATALGTPGLVVISVLTIASMTLGNLMALRQTDVVRLLAWSTVAQAGWVVLPLLSVSSAGAHASAAYLITYLVATIAAFTVVLMTVRAVGPAGRRLSSYRGLLRAQPWQGGVLLLALTSLAGLPPGIVGLVGKVVALQPVLAEGWWVVAVLAAGNAVLGIAVYLRWLRVVLQPAAAATAQAAVPETAPGRPRASHPSQVVALAFSTAALVLFSVQPQLFLAALR